MMLVVQGHLVAIDKQLYMQLFSRRRFGARQVERLVRVQASPYQRGLTAVLQQQLAATGLKGVRISNAMMELRCIANHPLIRSTLALSSLCLGVCASHCGPHTRKWSS